MLKVENYFVIIMIIIKEISLSDGISRKKLFIYFLYSIEFIIIIQQCQQNNRIMIILLIKTHTHVLIQVMIQSIA